MEEDDVDSPFPVPPLNTAGNPGDNLTDTDKRTVRAGTKEATDSGAELER